VKVREPQDTMTDKTQPTLEHPPVEVYPGAPLRAVAIEIFFPRTLDAVSRLGAFQRKRPEFSNARLAHEDNDGETVLLLNESESKGVAISPTMLSVITYSYVGGFAAFAQWAHPILDEALSILELRAYTRVGYRYENVIDAVDARAFSRMFAIGLPMPEGATAGAHAFVAWEQEWPNGDVFVDVSTSPDRPPVVRLDVSAGRNGPVSPSERVAAIAEAHRMGRLAFEALITPEFREQLRRGKP
jgi:uncharacterized protein (TIGR04255 family)